MNNLDVIKWGLNTLEIAAACTGLWYYRKFLPNRGPLYFAVYLCVISILELVGKYFAYYKMQEQNYLLYEWIATPLQFVAINGIYLFYAKGNTKKIIGINLLVYLLVTFTLLIYFSNDKNNKNYSFTVGTVVYVINTLVYFYFAGSSANIMQYKQQFMFWVVLGCLVFYLLTYPFFAFKNTIYRSDESLYFVLYYIRFACAYTMYLFFIIAYRCTKPNT